MENVELVIHYEKLHKLIAIFMIIIKNQKNNEATNIYSLMKKKRKEEKQKVNYSM